MQGREWSHPTGTGTPHGDRDTPRGEERSRGSKDMEHRETPWGQGQPMEHRDTPRENRDTPRGTGSSPPGATGSSQGVPPFPADAAGRPGAPAQGSGEGPHLEHLLARQPGPEDRHPLGADEGLRAPLQRQRGQEVTIHQQGDVGAFHGQGHAVPPAETALGGDEKRRGDPAAWPRGPGTHLPSARLTRRNTGYRSGGGRPSWSS